MLNLTTRVPLYNEQDDWWYVNGERYKRAYLQSLVLYDNGDFKGHAVGNGVYRQRASYTSVGAWTINEHSLLPTFTTGTTKYTFVFEEAIDLTQYSKLHVVTTKGEYTITFTSSNTLYLCMYSSGSGVGAMFCTQKQDFNDNRDNTISALDINETGFSITKIYLELKP